MMREEPDDDRPPALDDEVPSHLLKSEILNCDMCDEDGYRPNSKTCDHIDHTAVNKRGIAKVRAVLANKAARPNHAVALADPIPDDIVQRQRELGPPQQLSDPEPEL